MAAALQLHDFGCSALLPNPRKHAHLHVSQGIRSSGVAQPGRCPWRGPSPGRRLPARPAALLAAATRLAQQKRLHRCAGCRRGHCNLWLRHALWKASRHSWAGQALSRAVRLDWAGLWRQTGRWAVVCCCWRVGRTLLLLWCWLLLWHDLLVWQLRLLHRLLLLHTLLVWRLRLLGCLRLLRSLSLGVLLRRLIKGVPSLQVGLLGLLCLLLRLHRRAPSLRRCSACLWLGGTACQGFIIQQHSASVLGCKGDRSGSKVFANLQVRQVACCTGRGHQRILDLLRTVCGDTQNVQALSSAPPSSPSGTSSSSSATASTMARTASWRGSGSSAPLQRTKAACTAGQSKPTGLSQLAS